MVQEGNSPLASFVPLTPQLLKSLGNSSDTVLVKIDDKVGKSEGSYKVLSSLVPSFYITCINPIIMHHTSISIIFFPFVLVYKLNKKYHN